MKINVLKSVCNITSNLKCLNCHDAGIAWHQSGAEMPLSPSELYVSYLNLFRFILSECEFLRQGVHGWRKIISLWFLILHYTYSFSHNSVLM